jgi:hypothetical protein
MRDRRRSGGRGAGLIELILIVAFLAAVGLSLIVLTGAGPKLAGSLRSQEEAFNAAEAGFDAARISIEDRMSSGEWNGFAGRTLTEPTGIDRPFLSGAVNPTYFRRRTDEEILSALDPGGDGVADVTNVLFFHQTFAEDGSGATESSLTYTAFLIDDEAGGGPADPSDVLLVVIGAVRAGTRILSTCRLEIVLAMQSGGASGG